MIDLPKPPPLEPLSREESAYTDRRLDDTAADPIAASCLGHHPARSVCLSCGTALPPGVAPLCPGCSARRAVEKARERGQS